MSELPFLPVVPKLGIEVSIGTKKYRVLSISRQETDKFEECQIKIERVERFLRKDARIAIHKEPGGPVRQWSLKAD